MQPTTTTTPAISDTRSQNNEEEKVVESPSSSPGNPLGRLSATLLERINELCETWGIKLLTIQIVNMKAVDPNIEQQIESSSKIQFEQTNKLLIVNNEQRTKATQAQTDALVMQTLAEANAQKTVTEAEGYARALAIRTQADKDRVHILSSELHIPASEVLQLDMQLATAKAFSATQGTLMLGAGNASSLGLLSARRHSQPSLPVSSSTHTLAL